MAKKIEQQCSGAGLGYSRESESQQSLSDGKTGVSGRRRTRRSKTLAIAIRNKSNMTPIIGITIQLKIGM